MTTFTEANMSLWKMICSLVFAVCYMSGAIAASESPVGTWTTYDDKTGKKSAVVTIRDSGGVLSGVIDQIYPEPGETGMCDKCPGAFKGKKLVGMRLLWDLKKEGANEWDGGSILDPRSGKIYKLKVTVDGDKLHVRGYLGMSLLGRTQTWLR